MDRQGKRGVFILLLFWLFCFASTKWFHGNSPAIQNPSSVLLEPLTVQEKILLGLPLSMRQLSVEEWDILPHVGPTLAQRIVEYQKQNGPFKNIDELLQVKGMGPKTLESIRPYLK